MATTSEILPSWVTGPDDLPDLPPRGSGPPNAAYRRAWIARRRAHLIALLGGECVRCGEDGENDLLEFDHPEGRDWEPNKKSQWQRLALYAREIAQGKLRLLCRGCNGGHNPYRRRV